MKFRTLTRTTTLTTMAIGLLVSMTTAKAQSTDPTAPPPPTSPAAPSTGRPVEPTSDIPPPAEVPPTTPPPAPTQVQVAPVVPVAPAPIMVPAQPVTPVETEGQAYGYYPGRVRIGGALLVGGGFEDFAQSNVRSMTGTGGSWNVRAVSGTRQYVGLEAAYVGASRGIQTLGISSNSNLVSNGLEGALRLNVPIGQGFTLVEPFGFIGLGWQHYNLTNTGANTSDLAAKDDVMTMPYGAGLEVAYRRLMLDARFTYRQTYFNDLLRAEGGKLNTWGVGGNVGVEF